jgi:putative phage-type endonuclease
MDIVNLAQGGYAWELYRMEHANASEAAIIMDCAPGYWKMHTPYQLWQFKKGEFDPKIDSFGQAIMAHGIRMEPVALARAQEIIGVSIFPAVIEAEVGGLLMSASLDGLSLVDQAIKVEVKCPAKGKESETWRLAERGDVPEHYYWQIIHQELVAPTEKTYFGVLASDDEGGDDDFILLDMDEVNPAWRDDCSMLQIAWMDFFGSPPKPDWTEVATDEWHTAEQLYMAAKEDADEADERLKLCRANLIKLAEGADSDRVRGEALDVMRTYRKGAVDYKRVPELAGVSLEGYRKTGSETWTVRARRGSSGFARS